MKVNRDSWHYKLLIFMNDHEYNLPRSLCTYFWSTVFSVFAVVAAFLGALFLAFMLGLMISEIFTCNYDVFWLMWFVANTGKALLIGVVGVVVVVLFIFVGIGIEWCAEKLKLAYRNRFGYSTKPIKEPKVSKPKEPNLFFEWLKAKKEKVCPFIEYTGERKCD